MSEGQTVAKNPKRRLGRGLATLINDAADVAGATGVEGHRSVPIDAVVASTFNPRGEFREDELNELADSIREKGVVQPIIVRPASESGRFEIVAGERRWRAAQLAGLHDLPVIVRTLADKEALELAIIENVQRSDLNAMEEARGYQQLIKRYKHTQEDLSSIVGKSRSHLANTMRLLRLPKSVQDMIEEGALSAGHARALVGRGDAESLAKRIMQRGLNVRDVEAMVQKADAGEGASAKKKRVGNADTRAAESELSDALGLGVSILPGKGEKGELRIAYTTLEQFEAVRAKLLAKSK